MPSDLQVSNIKDLTGSNTGLSIASDGQVTIAQNNPTLTLGSNATFPAGHVLRVFYDESDAAEHTFTGGSSVDWDELDISIPVDAITDLHWNMEIDFVIRSEGASGTVMTSLRFHNEDNSGSDSAHTHMETTLANVNTLILNTLDVRATWVSPVAGDEIYSEIMNLHKIF